MDQFKSIADMLSAIIFKLDNGEELKIKNPTNIVEDGKDAIIVFYECRFYDATGAHTVTKFVCVNYDHVVYTRYEFKEGYDGGDATA